MRKHTKAATAPRATSRPLMSGALGARTAPGPRTSALGARTSALGARTAPGAQNARSSIGLLGTIGAAGLVWFGIRQIPALRREIKMWKM